MTSIRVALLVGDDLRSGGAELIDVWEKERSAKLWVDIEDPDAATLEPLLEQRFGFHELASEDSLSPTTLPKYDPFAAYDFFIFRAVDIDLQEHGSQTIKLASFLGANFLFTIHRTAMSAINAVRDRLGSDKRLIINGTDFLLYTIVDHMIDAHFPLLDKFEECVDALQDAIFLDARPSHLDELLHLKRDANVLRRQSFPQRELLNQISRGDAQFVQKTHLIYYRDVYDHMFRISETIDVLRDTLSGTMEAYLSVVANRTNEIMRVLTVFSAILLPLTLIAGIYGMNFDHMPELHWMRGYPLVLGLMAVTALLLFGYFRRRGWVGRTPESPKPPRL